MVLEIFLQRTECFKFGDNFKILTDVSLNGIFTYYIEKLFKADIVFI